MTIKTVVTSAVIILCYGNIATAQDFPSLNKISHKSAEIKFNSQPTKNALKNNSQSRSTTNLKPQKQLSTIRSLMPLKVAQATESKPLTQSQTPANPNIENLEPNANPLQFPTQPQEVEVDTQKPITLQQAIELAIKYNKDLQESQLNLERSQKELQEARAALYPTVETQLDLSESKSAGSERSLELARQQGSSLIDQQTTTDSLNGTLSLNYNVYTGGRRGADIQRAARQVRFNELDVERISFEVRFEASRDYYNLQNADAQVEIEQAAVQDAQQTLKDAQLLEKAGLGTRFDVLRAEVELANAQQRLTRAEADQSTSRRQLAETLSVGQQVELITADEIQPASDWQFSLPETIVLAYKNRAELEQLLVRREINAKQRQIALSTIKPQVSVFASYDVLDVYDDDIDLTDGYSFGTRLQWSLFDGGAAVARARQSETDIKIDETQFANQRNQIRFQVEQAYYNLTASKENITTSQKAVQLAEESLRLARLRFQAGVGTQTDVIQAQSELTTARGNYLRAVIDYNQSLNQLQRAVTNLPEGKLFDLPSN